MMGFPNCGEASRELAGQLFYCLRFEWVQHRDLGKYAGPAVVLDRFPVGGVRLAHHHDPAHRNGAGPQFCQRKQGVVDGSQARPCRDYGRAVRESRSGRRSVPAHSGAPAGLPLPPRPRNGRRQGPLPFRTDPGSRSCCRPSVPTGEGRAVAASGFRTRPPLPGRISPAFLLRPYRRRTQCRSALASSSRPCRNGAGMQRRRSRRLSCRRSCRFRLRIPRSLVGACEDRLQAEHEIPDLPVRKVRMQRHTQARGAVGHGRRSDRAEVKAGFAHSLRRPDCSLVRAEYHRHDR